MAGVKYQVCNNSRTLFVYRYLFDVSNLPLVSNIDFDLKSAVFCCIVTSTFDDQDTCCSLIQNKRQLCAGHIVFKLIMYLEIIDKTLYYVENIVDYLHL